MASNFVGRRRQFTDEEIREIFTNDPEDMYVDAEEDVPESDDSSDEELPENLTALDEVDERLDLEDSEVSFEWKMGNLIPRPVNFARGCSGVKRLPNNNKEAECFKMFMTTSVMDMIVAETNTYAQSLREKISNGKLAKWVDTTVAELYVFLAVFFSMGLIKKNNIRDYWTTNPLLSTPFFGTIFSQDRFLLLLRCLHFSNSTSNDPLRKIRSIITPIVQSFN